MKWLIERRDDAGVVARQRLARALEPVGPCAMVDDALLMTSELVTNVMVHTDDDCTLYVDLDRARGTILVAVTDASPWVIADPDAPPAGRAGGFGLKLVAQLATRWGCDTGISTKTVWFQLDLAEQSP
jgi:hypothetical protein